MASIVELTLPDNARLCRGAMQNWRDLVTRGPAWAPGVPEPVDVVGRSVAIVGPHPPALITEVAQQAARVTVIVRAIPDAAEIARAVPTARVLCGDLGDATAVLADEPAGAEHDVVMALDDLTRVASAEGPARSWLDLATLTRQLARPDGVVWLAIENDGGIHRTHTLPAPATTDWDADWSPLATWDGSRPRTRAQLDEFVGTSAEVWTLHPDWRRPTVVSSTPSTDLSRSFTAALAGAPHSGNSGHVLGLRSAALADTLEARCAGWIVRLGGDPEATESATCRTVTSPTARWTVDCRGARTDAGHQCVVPDQGRTLLRTLVELCLDNDLPAIRREITAWQDHVRSVAEDQIVPAVHADARFGNLAVAADGSLGALLPGTEPAPVDTVLWVGLADFLGVLRSQGIRHPWPRIQQPETTLGALGAMAGLDPSDIPADVLSRPTPPVVDDGRSRDELLAVTARQDAELRTLWSRLKWSESQYATHRAIEAGKARTTKARRQVRRALAHGKDMVRGRRRGS